MLTAHANCLSNRHVVFFMFSRDTWKSLSDSTTSTTSAYITDNRKFAHLSDISYSHQLSSCISLAILVDVVFTEGNEQGESTITFKFCISIPLTTSRHKRLVGLGGFWMPLSRNSCRIHLWVNSAVDSRFPVDWGWSISRLRLEGQWHGSYYILDNGNSCNRWLRAWMSWVYW
jgi:hypothetical protein